MRAECGQVSGGLADHLEWTRQQLADALPGGLECGACGRAVRVVSLARFGNWRHVSAADEAPCREIRLAAAVAANEARLAAMSDEEREREVRAWGERGRKVYAAPVMPRRPEWDGWESDDPPPG